MTRREQDRREARLRTALRRTLKLERDIAMAIKAARCYGCSFRAVSMMATGVEDQPMGVDICCHAARVLQEPGAEWVYEARA